MRKMYLKQFSCVPLQILLKHNGCAFYSVSAKHHPAEYCIDLVRRYDYENYLSTLLLPSKFRSAAFAIRAFNIEVARVQDAVSESRIGQMRLKFWEETLEQLYKDLLPEHPVALQLHRAVKKHSLSKRYLKRLITIRENYLMSNVFPNMSAMENYAEQSVSSIFYLILESAGIENLHADHVASHLGKAQGIVNLIRSTGHNAQQKIMTLPQDLMLQNNVSHEQLYRKHPSEGLTETVFFISSIAMQHLRKARSMSKQIPKQASVIFLPAVMVEASLNKLEKYGFNIFEGPLQIRNAFLPLSLYWHKVKSTY